MNLAGRRGIPSGFTLLELLLVIAVLAILAALLLTAVSQTKRKAGQIKCVNNLRQLAIAVSLYASDNNDATLPLYAPAQSPEGPDDYDYWSEVLVAQVSDLSDELFLCPNDTVSTNYSYGLNEDGFPSLIDTDPPTEPLHLSGFANPSGIIMMGDLGTSDDFVTQRPDTLVMLTPDDDLKEQDEHYGNYARPSARHSQRCNLNFVDGHVESFRLDQFYTNQVPEDKWFDPNP